MAYILHRRLSGNRGLKSTLLHGEAKPVLVILSIGTNFNPAIPGASNPSICTNFNPTIPGAPNPPGKNRVKVEFAHGPHNLYLSIAVEIVLQGNLLYSVIIVTLK